MANGIFDHIYNRKKGETYEVADAFARAAIENLNALKIEFVSELPTEDIDTRTIYFVPSSSATTENVYDEYINTDGTTSGWEIIGSTAVDLSQYYTSTQTDTLLADKVDKVTGKGLSTEDYTTAEQTKLAGIETGAEANVQSDWNQSNTAADDYIKNKPTIPSALSDLSDDSTHRTVTDSEKTTWSGKVGDNPTFTEASTRANISSGESFSTILGKIKKFFTDLKTVAFSGSYNDLTDKPTIPSAQIQSDWNQSTTTEPDYIKNKPSLANVATSGSYTDLSNTPTIPAAQVNSDWNATSGKAQILNKPTIPDISTKMDKTNPEGTGSFSMNRLTGSTVGGSSHAEGNDCTASDFTSHAEGHETISSGPRAHAEGRQTTASGGQAHAEGEYTEANGIDSHAEGLGTIAASGYQHAGGRYNIADNADTYAEIIGNGTSDSSRSNARTLDWNGNETIAGDLYFKGRTAALSAQLPGDYKHNTHSQTINNSTLTQITSVTLSKGYWLVFGSVSFSDNGTGRRAASLFFSDQSTTNNEFTVTQPPISGGATHMQVHALYYASGNITAYVQGWHNAGTNLTGCGARIAAIRIS